MSDDFLINLELLEDVKQHAENEYTLKELFKELDIPIELLDNEQILEAFNVGLEENYIVYAVDGISDEDIADNFEITAEQCLLWSVKHSEEIKKQIEDAKKKIKNSTRQFSDPLTSGIINILTHNGNMSNNDSSEVSSQQVADEIREMVKKMQEGDNTEMLNTLVSMNLQLQAFNQTITRNLVGEAGKQLVNFELLAKMQSRVIGETRKNIMAINEICNPKRATFIKEANQYNNLHQKVSEKKEENQNELQKKEFLEAPAVVTDAEIMPLKDKVQ